MPKVLADRIIFDQEDFLAGMGPGFSNNAIQTVGPGAAFLSNINPLREQIGACVPGGNPTDATTVSVVDTILQNATVSRGGTTYAFAVSQGTGARVHRIDVTTDPVTFTNDTPGTGFPRTIGAHATHGAVSGSDIIIYNRQAGASDIRQEGFYSWDDVNDGDVGRFALSGAPGFDDDFMSTVPGGAATLTGARPHPMILGPDGLLYIGHDRFVASYDGINRVGGGNDGQFTAQALDLPYGFIVSSFSADYTRNFLIIYAYRTLGTAHRAQITFRGESYAFFWDMLSPTWTIAVDLTDNFVDGGFSFHGLPGCFTWGRGQDFATTNQGKLRLYDGRSFKTLAHYSGDAAPHGGVEIYGDMILWTAEGRLWAWGRPYPSFPDKLYQLTAGSGTDEGLLKNFGSNNIYLSSGTTTSGGLQRMNSNYHSAAEWEGLTVEPMMPFHKRCEVIAVKTYFSSIASGGRALALDLITDKNQVTTNVFTGVTAVTGFGTAESATSKQLISEANVTPGGAPLPKFSDVKLNLTWSTGTAATDAPEVNRVEIFYRPINI